MKFICTQHNFMTASRRDTKEVFEVLFSVLFKVLWGSGLSGLAAERACGRLLNTPFAGKPADGLQQPQLAGTRHRFGPPLDPQLVEDESVVPFHRTQREEEPLADLLIRASLGDELQHFTLPPA